MSEQGDKLRGEIDELLRSEMVTIGIDVDDAKTGQMWAYDSERLSKRILALITEGLKKQIDIKRDFAFGESLFGSLEHQAQMQAMVDAYTVVLNLIKDIGGKE